MEKISKFTRCIYCFSEKEEDSTACPVCGYADGFTSLPGWWLTPGTILKGRYIVGQSLKESEEKLEYLGWDLKREREVEIAEYFPKKYVTRDVTLSARVSCIPGMEEELDQGKQSFFEKAKTFFFCINRVEHLRMDFFLRNNTCYYVKKKSSRVDKQA